MALRIFVSHLVHFIYTSCSDLLSELQSWPDFLEDRNLSSQKVNRHIHFKLLRDYSLTNNLEESLTKLCYGISDLFGVNVYVLNEHNKVLAKHKCTQLGEGDSTLEITAKRATNQYTFRYVPALSHHTTQQQERKNTETTPAEAKGTIQTVPHTENECTENTPPPTEYAQLSQSTTDPTDFNQSATTSSPVVLTKQTTSSSPIHFLSEYPNTLDLGQEIETHTFNNDTLTTQETQYDMPSNLFTSPSPTSNVTPETHVPSQTNLPIPTTSQTHTNLPTDTNASSETYIPPKTNLPIPTTSQTHTNLPTGTNASSETYIPPKTNLPVPTTSETNRNLPTGTSVSQLSDSSPAHSEVEPDLPAKSSQKSKKSTTKSKLKKSSKGKLTNNLNTRPKISNPNITTTDINVPFKKPQKQKNLKEKRRQQSLQDLESYIEDQREAVKKTLPLTGHPENVKKVIADTECVFNFYQMKVTNLIKTISEREDQYKCFVRQKSQMDKLVAQMGSLMLTCNDTKDSLMEDVKNMEDLHSQFRQFYEFTDLDCEEKCGTHCIAYHAKLVQQVKKADANMRKSLLYNSRKN